QELIKVYFDSDLALQTTLTSALGDLQWRLVGLGLWGSNLAGPSELYFDDFALSTERIGCD
ncbi:MAG: hypothetical protein VB934_09790, partial [Polyangiaceae bacterium]